jgi:cell division protease FtsH
MSQKQEPSQVVSRRLLAILLSVLGLVLLVDVWYSAGRVVVLDYSDFLAHLDAGNVSSVAVGEERIEGQFREPTIDGRRSFVTLAVQPGLASQLAKYPGLRFSGLARSGWLSSVLGWLLPVLLLMWGLRWMASRAQGSGGLTSGLMAVGRSRARVYAETGVGVSFDDVAGVDEAKEELREVVGFLKDPSGHGRLGARIPRGILLVGPPGTGKTLLARAVAGEAGVPFLSINGSEFVELFVGVGAARVRDLFEQARRVAPAIIFIDEIDALGRARGAFGLGGHDEKEQTLNQLLAELDGFDPRVGVVLLAATNRPEILDPALLRAGRFDRQVLVDRPDRRGRVQILQVHLRKIRLDAAVVVEQIAAITPGFSGADLANLVNEAALVATRQGRESVAMEDFTVALERIVAGLEKRNRLLNPIERRAVAYHEMGHALVAMTLVPDTVIHKVSIIPRGVGALGYTIQRPTEDRFLMTARELRNKMAVLMAGRAAEQLALNEISTGAADDLSRVTDIARSMVVQYGMIPALGPVSLEAPPSTFGGPPAGMPWLSPERSSMADRTAREVDEAVRQLVREALDDSTAVLMRQRARLDAGASALLEHETLNDQQLRTLRADIPENGAGSSAEAQSGFVVAG